MMQMITIIAPIVVSLFLCEVATNALEKEKHMLCCLIVVTQSILIAISVNSITLL